MEEGHVWILAAVPGGVRTWPQIYLRWLFSSKNFYLLLMVDAYRLKRNFGYWLMSYHKVADILKREARSVVEHHFNNPDTVTFGVLCRRMHYKLRPGISSIVAEAARRT
jgi:hypothetical protein